MSDMATHTDPRVVDAFVRAANVSAEIEAVARAICEAERMNPDDPLGGWRHWIDAAEAAVRACRRTQRIAHTTSFLTPERLALEAEILGLRKRKFSYAEIGEKLGLSRSAVAGICWRAKRRAMR